MIDDFYQLDPYELNKEDKNRLLMSELIELTRFHKEHCSKYSGFLEAIHYNENMVKGLEDIPFFPVRMFKEYNLLSIDRSSVFKTMTSSGTTGQRVSKIFLDRETAMIQQKVMNKILSDFWGKKRLPLLVIDTPAVLKDRKMFSARGSKCCGERNRICIESGYVTQYGGAGKISGKIRWREIYNFWIYLYGLAAFLS